MEFYGLSVRDTFDEIEGQAKTVTFEVPSKLKDIFTWSAGQHITLRFNLNNEEVRRSYSISSSPHSGEPLRITVKRIDDGLISNYVNDNIKSGDEIEVAPPYGRFTLVPDSKLRRTHYFFGAGSGITPLYSMIHTVLSSEPYSDVYLLYGNKSESSIIFNERLSKLEQEYGERFLVSHVLSNQSIWSKFKPWKKGRIEAKTIAEFFSEFAPYAQDTQYYVCGPGSMNSSIITALRSSDVPSNRIHHESYGLSEGNLDESVKGVPATLSVKISGENYKLNVLEGETLLQAMKREGLNPPYSCESGVCSACSAKVTEGSIHMRACMALDETEIEEGKVLTCQSLPTSKEISIQYLE